MTIPQIIEVLLKIDNFLWWGDRDSAHALIQELIKKLKEK